VYEATEPVSSQRPDGRSGVPIGAARGRLLMERSVWTVGVVMLDVLAPHRREVTRSDDQEMIEAFGRPRRRRVTECGSLDAVVKSCAYLHELIDAATQVEAVPAGCHRRHTTRFF
jgi:hypothetical protein